MFEFVVVPVNARWRPSGDGTPQAYLLPRCSHNGKALPFEINVKQYRTLLQNT